MSNIIILNNIRLEIIRLNINRIDNIQLNNMRLNDIRLGSLREGFPSNSSSICLGAPQHLGHRSTDQKIRNCLFPRIRQIQSKVEFPIRLGTVLCIGVFFFHFQQNQRQKIIVSFFVCHQQFILKNFHSLSKTEKKRFSIRIFDVFFQYTN